MKLISMTVLAAIGAVDIDAELNMSGIDTTSLLMRRPQGLFNSTGPALREKIFELQGLYQKHKSVGLNGAETTSLLQIRKLLQLKSMVTQLLADNSIDFDRFCFYGCYCLPDSNVHDASPGTGTPVDEIDRSCHELKMCYQCANKDSIEETGDSCHQDSAYSVEPIRNENGQVIDYTCSNTAGSCRWRNCQCDRAFAHKIKEEHEDWNRKNHIKLGGFDRGQCEVNIPARGVIAKTCCGAYDSPYGSQQRQIINPDIKQCCAKSNEIKPYGEMC